MQTVSGRIARFLEDPRYGMRGFFLDSEQLVKIPTEQAHLASSILHVGSYVGVEGVRHSGSSGEVYWQPSLIINFDSKRSMSFLAPIRQVGPGMPSRETAPNVTASLVHPDQVGRAESDRCRREDSDAQQARDQSANAMSESYDTLHRVQAVLAYLHIMQRKVAGIGQLLDEAKRTYEQALARFQDSSFVAASDFAAASNSLSRVVEILISRELRSDSGLPSLVPPPPAHSTESCEVEQQLDEAECALGRIHWLVENGTRPLEERTQVRRIAGWGDALYKQAQRSYFLASLCDAVEFAEAALASARSAEHVCRKRYTGHAGPSGHRFSEALRLH
jgi:hypothetical protein